MSPLLALLSRTPSGPPTPQLAWRNVATGCRYRGTNHTTPAQATATTSHTLMRDATAIRVSYSPTPGGGDTTYTATVNGHPLAWAGQPTVTVPGGTPITSDPLPLPAQAGDVLEVTTQANGYRVLALPVKISGITADPSVLVVGSSSGIPEDFTQPMWDAGLPTTNASIGGSYATTFDAAMLDLIGLEGFTHAFVQVGINSNPDGYVAMCQGAVDLAWRLRERGVGHVTQMVWKPWTTSTDGWTTIEGQAPAHQARAVAVAWLRRGAPVQPDGKTFDLYGSTGSIYVGHHLHPFDALVDFSEPLQAAGHPDLYRVDAGQLTADGLHLTAAGYALAAPRTHAWADAVAGG